VKQVFNVNEMGLYWGRKKGHPALTLTSEVKPADIAKDV
jgi:hypothetical protein